MQEKQALIKKINTNLILHPKIIEILYENKHYVKSVFKEIKGLFNIDYFSLKIINPADMLIAFSSSPNIEYNLINSGLWKYDIAFLKHASHEHILIHSPEEIPENIQNKLNIFKYEKNNLFFYFLITRRIDEFYVNYSFATKNIDTLEDLILYYDRNFNHILRLGDHCYKSLSKLYLNYCSEYPLPKVKHFTKILKEKNKRHVRLIVNNL